MEALDKLDYREITRFNTVRPLEHAIEQTDILQKLIERYSEANSGASFYELKKIIAQKSPAISLIKASEFSIKSGYINWHNYANLIYPWDGDSIDQLESALIDINSRFYHDMIFTESVAETMSGLLKDIRTDSFSFDKTGFDELYASLRRNSNPEIDLSLAPNIRKKAEELAWQLYILPEKTNAAVKCMLEQQKNKSEGKGFDQVRMARELERYTDKTALKNAFTELYLIAMHPTKMGREFILGNIWDMFNSGKIDDSMINYRHLKTSFGKSIGARDAAQARSYFIKDICGIVEHIEFDGEKALEIKAKTAEMISDKRSAELEARVKRCFSSGLDERRMKPFYQDVYNFVQAFYGKGYHLNPNVPNPYLLPAASAKELSRIRKAKSLLEGAMSMVPGNKVNGAYRFYERTMSILDDFLGEYEGMPEYTEPAPKKHDVSMAYKVRKRMPKGEKAFLGGLGVAGGLAIILMTASILYHSITGETLSYKGFVEKSKHEVHKVVDPYMKK